MIPVVETCKCKGAEGFLSGSCAGVGEDVLGPSPDERTVTALLPDTNTKATTEGGRYQFLLVDQQLPQLPSQCSS